MSFIPPAAVFAAIPANACRRGRAPLGFPLNPCCPGSMNLALRSLLCVAVVLLISGCSPTVKVEAPTEPITINLNVKVDAEVRVKLEKQAEEDIKKNPGIF